MAKKTQGETLLTDATSVDPRWLKRQSRSRPKWDEWINLADVLLWQAVALSLDMDPPKHYPEGLDDDFDKRMRIAISHLTPKGLLKHVNAVDRKHMTTVRLADIAQLAAALPSPWRLPAGFPKAEPVVAVWDGIDEPRVQGQSKWHLTKPKRFQGYAAPLYVLLKVESDAGRACPKASDVLAAWAAKLPPGGVVLEVLPTEIKYEDANGKLKTADLEAIRKAIVRMTSRSADD
jgi:hypothetical protein